MDRLLDVIMTWVRFCLEFLTGIAGSVIGAFRWPAEMTGIPAEIWATAVTCFVLIALWRALGGYFD